MLQHHQCPCRDHHRPAEEEWEEEGEGGRQTCSISMPLEAMLLPLLKSRLCVELLPIISSSSSRREATRLRRQGVGGCEKTQRQKEGGMEGKEG